MGSFHQSLPPNTNIYSLPKMKNHILLSWRPGRALCTHSLPEDLAHLIVQETQRG